MDSENIQLNGYRESLLSALKMQRTFVSASQDILVDKNGNEVYDALAQYGTVVLGHNNEAINRSVIEFLNSKACCFIQPNITKPTAALAQQLIHLSGDIFKRVCFSNSGAESVEAAIKLARLSTGRAKVVSLHNSFHGKTYSALSASGSDRYKEPNISDDENYIKLNVGDIATFESTLSNSDIAAFIFEPVLGEGGMEQVCVEFLQAAIRLCKRNGVVVIADEIQCGLYRCGDLSVALAQRLDVDVLLLGKGLSGGLMPIGAVLYKKLPNIAEFEKKHSSTFAGGGLACSAGLSALQELNTEHMANHIEALSTIVDLHASKLNKSIRSVSITGLGLLRGISFSDPHRHSNYFAVFCHNSGFLAYLLCSYLLNRYSIFTMPLLSRPSAIRFEPPLTTSPDKLEYFFNAVADIGRLLGAGRYDILMAHLTDVDIAELKPATTSIPVTNSTLPTVETLSYDMQQEERYDFAFLMHLTDLEDVITTFPKAIREEYDRQAQLKLAQLFLTAGELDNTPAVCLAFRSPCAERSVKGLLLLSPLKAERMLRLSRSARQKLLDAYFAIISKHDISRVGLGGYTSVISNAGSSLVSRYPDISITTGNRLTAIAISDQFRQLCSDHDRAKVYIIGARGSVGAAVTLELARSVPQLFLLGRSNASVSTYHGFLTALFKEILNDNKAAMPFSVARQIKEYAKHNANDNTTTLIAALCTESLQSTRPIIVSSHIEQAIQQAKFIISCTSEGKPFISTSLLGPDAIVLDGARPFDFVADPSCSAQVYQAGLTKQPQQLAIGDCNMAIDQPGVGLACFNETLLLANEEIAGNYGIGSSMRPDEIQRIQQLASQKGFKPYILKATHAKLTDYKNTNNKSNCSHPSSVKLTCKR